MHGGKPSKAHSTAHCDADGGDGQYDPESLYCRLCTYQPQALGEHEEVARHMCISEFVRAVRQCRWGVFPMK